MSLCARTPDGLWVPCPLGLGPLASRARVGRERAVLWDRVPSAGTARGHRGPNGFQLPLLACLHQEVLPGPRKLCWLAHPSQAWWGHKGQAASPATSSSLWSHICPPSHQPGSWGFTPDPSPPPFPAAPEPRIWPCPRPSSPSSCPSAQPVPWPRPPPLSPGLQSSFPPALPAALSDFQSTSVTTSTPCLSFPQLQGGAHCPAVDQALPVS